MNNKLREKIVIFTFIVMSIFLITSTLSNGLLTDNLVNYYSFDEDWGSFSYGNYTDVISGNNFSQNSPLSKVIGKINRDVNTNGVVGYFGLSANTQSFTTPFSINMWALSHTNQSNTLYCSLLSITPYQFCIILNDVSTGGNIYILSGKSGGTNLDACDTNYATDLNSWNMITTIWKNDNEIEIFVNGTSIKNCSITKSFGVPIKTTIFAYLYDLPSTALSDSEIDELGVWNKTLSYQEISDLFNSGNGLAYPFMSCTENWIANNTECNGYNYTIQYYDSNNCSTTVNLSIDNGTIINCECVNDWTRTIQPCNNGIRLISYSDNNYCNTTHYPIPISNNTYEECTIKSVCCPIDINYNLIFHILLLLIIIATLRIAFLNGNKYMSLITVTGVLLIIYSIFLRTVFLRNGTNLLSDLFSIVNIFSTALIFIGVACIPIGLMIFFELGFASKESKEKRQKTKNN